MSNEIQGTQTEKNLQEAFISEATAIVKYKLFAEESGLEFIADKFEYIAKHEMEHAKAFLSLLEGLGDDKTNLKNSVALEGFVSTIDYPDAAIVAEEEGFTDIAKKFRDIASIEARHKKTLEWFLKEYETGAMLKKSSKVKWVCMECGYIHEGVEPPMVCPVCNHKREDYKLYREGD